MSKTPAGAGESYATPLFSPVVEGVTPKYNVEKRGSDVFYFLSDHLGSSSYITNAAGKVSQQMEYLPFGEIAAQRRFIERLNK